MFETGYEEGEDEEPEYSSPVSDWKKSDTDVNGGQPLVYWMTTRKNQVNLTTSCTNQYLRVPGWCKNGCRSQTWAETLRRLEGLKPLLFSVYKIYEIMKNYV